MIINPTTVVGSDGEDHGPFDNAEQAVLHAKLLYPGQQQDEEMTGVGWDVKPGEAPKA